MNIHVNNQQMICHSALSHIPPPIFHSVHCDGVKNMKFVNAQQAKEIVPVDKYQKRLYNTNTW